ncbi:MAG: AAA family ATPase [Candidatus Lokiarchaeota archaeon]|nr:AAA family ATPase [Candidatus Lokiarchaeota archaeon]
MKNQNNNYQFNIDKFYKNYLNGPRIFNNRDALESSYIPEDLPHRDFQIKNIAEKTACALLGDTPPSFLCYGMTGTGKTATIRYVSQKLAQQNSEIKPWWIYINCNIVSTPYRILAHIYNTISRSEKIPPTGLPKDIIFKKLLGLLDSRVGNSICFLVLDEIDIVVGKKGGNEILYDLTRLNENLDNCKTSIIGISNKLKFRQNLDPRILSSLGEEHIVFPSYDASELRDILTERAKIAYQEDVLKEGVIPLCAALAAKEHGDARKALQLLRKAGELAERAQNKIVTAKHVENAQEDLENDHIIEYIKGMPLQAQLVLTSIYLISKFSPEHIIISGDIYDVYSEIRGLIPGVRKLTKRRISDYINELSLAGIISAEVKSMGHYGRTKIIKLDIEIELIEKCLLEIDKIQGILNHKPVFIQSDKVKLKNNIFKKLV